MIPEVEVLTLVEAMAELLPYVGQSEYAVVMEMTASSMPFFATTDRLESVQGLEGDFAMVLLEPDTRLDLRADEIKSIRGVRGSGSLIIELGSITITLDLQDG
jgi:hypothetical protein